MQMQPHRWTFPVQGSAGFTIQRTVEKYMSNIEIQNKERRSLRERGQEHQALKSSAKTEVAIIDLSPVQSIGEQKTTREV